MAVGGSGHGGAGRPAQCCCLGQMQQSHHPSDGAPGVTRAASARSGRSEARHRQLRRCGLVGSGAGFQSRQPIPRWVGWSRPWSAGAPTGAVQPRRRGHRTFTCEQVGQRGGAALRISPSASVSHSASVSASSLRALPAWTLPQLGAFTTRPATRNRARLTLTPGSASGMSSCGQVAVWLRGIWASGTRTSPRSGVRPARLTASFLATTPGLRTASASWDGDADGVR